VVRQDRLLIADHHREGGQTTLSRNTTLNLEFLVSPLARRVAEGFSVDAAPAPRDVGAERQELRTLVTSRFGFGGIAAVGVQRPADLLPVVYQVIARGADGSARSIEESVSLLGGAGMAGTFAASLAARHGRSVDAFSLPGALPIVLRSAGAAAASPHPAQASTQSWTTPAPVPAPPGSSVDLSPELVQRLTEQIVRSLDARALAERERMGRF
jgi:hypothetical protein